MYRSDDAAAAARATVALARYVDVADKVRAAYRTHGARPPPLDAPTLEGAVSAERVALLAERIDREASHLDAWAKTIAATRIPRLPFGSRARFVSVLVLAQIVVSVAVVFVTSRSRYPAGQPFPPAILIVAEAIALTVFAAVMFRRSSLPRFVPLETFELAQRMPTATTEVEVEVEPEVEPESALAAAREKRR